jgi:hypothetical protein
MGELSGTGGGIQGEKLATDQGVHDTPEPAAEPTPTDIKGDGGEVDTGDKSKEAPKGYATDVEDIFADGSKGDIPVFDVSPDEFNNNMKMDRRRLRFKAGSKAAEYMRKTKYNRPFWIRNTKDGYMRKISRS